MLLQTPNPPPDPTHSLECGLRDPVPWSPTCDLHAGVLRKWPWGSLAKPRQSAFGQLMISYKFRVKTTLILKQIILLCQENAMGSHLGGVLPWTRWALMNLELRGAAVNLGLLSASGSWFWNLPTTFFWTTWSSFIPCNSSKRRNYRPHAPRCVQLAGFLSLFFKDNYWMCVFSWLLVHSVLP